MFLSANSDAQTSSGTGHPAVQGAFPSLASGCPDTSHVGRSVRKATTINAAFLQEIKHDDVRLKQIVRRLATFVRARSFDCDRVHGLAKLLGQFRDQLAFHFALEEAFGYFDEALDHAPRLSNWAAHLRVEHGLLYDWACCLATKGEELVGESSPLSDLAQLRRDTRALLEQLDEHERSENGLIQDAFNIDLGGGD